MAIPLATSPKAIESEKVKYELPDAYLRHLISYHGVFTHTIYQQFSKRGELQKEFNVNNITLTLPFANVGITV